MSGFFRKIKAREAYHPTLTYPAFVCRVSLMRKRYKAVVARIRAKSGRVVVAFLTAGPSKWKCQSIYAEMVHTPVFEPWVVCDSGDKDFYVRRGCANVVCSLDEVNADAVIYQDPWAESSERNPVWEVSRSALCLYVPYSIESIRDSRRSERFDYHHLANFHSLMFACFQWSPDYAAHYKAAQFPWEFAGKVLGFGHPTLDAFVDGRSFDDGLVIYAPHFSFPGGIDAGITDIGTFNWSGRAVLDYAKGHPEIKWAFKPHPKLKARLVENGHMTQDDADRYYSDWERIGVACYDGDYADLFMRSRAMITDSNSFLLEYMATGRPLIHLIPKECKMVPCPQAQKVFDTFYRVKDESEMRQTFKLVLEDGRDPRRDDRVAASREACVLGNHAGKRIVDWLAMQCGRGEC